MKGAFFFGVMWVICLSETSVRLFFSEVLPSSTRVRVRMLSASYSKKRRIRMPF